MTWISLKKLTWNWPVNKLLGIISLFLVSCDTPKEIGESLFSVEVGLNYSDTITVKSSTILMDSIHTGASGTFLLGSYYHPDLGYVSSGIYAQIANADTLRSKENSIVDSVKMLLVYKAYMGDLSQQQSISIYKLKDSLSRTTEYLANSSVAIEPTLVTKYSFIPKPIRAKSTFGDSLQYDTLNFHVNKTIGKELLGAYTDKNLVAGGNAFRIFFRGFYFQPESGIKAALLSFSAPYSRMTVYWHNPGDVTKFNLDYYFSLSNSYTKEFNARFNQMKAMRVGSLSALQKPGNSILSSKTNNITYVQSGTGIATKIDLPYLNNLKGNKNIAVNKAELVFTSIDKIDLNNTIGQLALLEADGSNKPLRNAFGYRYVPSEGGGGIQTANFNSYSNAYTFNVTTAIQAVLSGKISNLGFILSPTLTLNSAGYTRLSSESARFVPLNATKAKLKIYYSYIAK